MILHDFICACREVLHFISRNRSSYVLKFHLKKYETVPSHEITTWKVCG